MSSDCLLLKFTYVFFCLQESATTEKNTNDEKAEGDALVTLLAADGIIGISPEYVAWGSVLSKSHANSFFTATLIVHLMWYCSIAKNLDFLIRFVGKRSNLFEIIHFDVWWQGKTNWSVSSLFWYFMCLYWAHFEKHESCRYLDVLFCQF